MRNEYLLLKEKDLKSQQNDLLEKILKHVGIVPEAWYDELDAIELKILNFNKV